MANDEKGDTATVYIRVMKELFARHSAEKVDEFEWSRSEIKEICEALGVREPKNLGDNIYSIRHGREALPEEILKLAKPRHWLLLPNGKGKYKFVKAKNGPFAPDTTLRAIKVPNSTPQIVERYALGDEQAVLARIRYNRLIDLFLGIAAFPLQSHLRTTVEHFARSQIETDELYVGVDKCGIQYVIPVQAKGRDEIIGAVQAIQDIYCCRERFPHLVCKAIAAQTIDISKTGSGTDVYTIALMELAIDAGSAYDVSKVQERHFKLVEHTEITSADLDEYKKQS
ncbi:hypothetical protein [Methyloceanibacter sp.]|uniref:hypothetical protein n=1 Tax=Methyloceanibacter sp. TaxID=1965321 RepID=UPI003D6CD93C